MISFFIFNVFNSNNRMTVKIVIIGPSCNTTGTGTILAQSAVETAVMSLNHVL
jgi:hypothetical protein